MPRAHDLSTVGGRIASARAKVPKYRKDQERLAHDVRVSRGTVSAWENDQQTPAGENLVRLARALSVSPEWILDGRGAEPSRGHLVVRDTGVISYDPSADSEATPAEALFEFLDQRVGMRRLTGNLTSKDLIAVAYTIAREERFGPDEFKKIDRWRDEIMAMERRPES